MVAKLKSAGICYAAGVVLSFVLLGLYVAADQKGDVPTVVEYIYLPGTLFTTYCLVGVHSDYFILASTVANIGVFLLFSYLLWKLFDWTRAQKSKGGNSGRDNVQ